MIHADDRATLKYMTDLTDQALRFLSFRESGDPTLIKLMQYAIVRIFEIMGERSKGLKPITKYYHADFPWETLQRMRDLLNHSHCQLLYKDQEHDLFSQIFSDLPELADRLRAMKEDPDSSTDESEFILYRSDETALQHLTQDDDKGLAQIRHAVRQLLMERINTDFITQTDLAILKSRMRLPKLDLIVIQEETANILLFLNKFTDTTDIGEAGLLTKKAIMLAIQHSIGVLGQSAKNIRGFHTNLYFEHLFSSLSLFIRYRDEQLHDKKSFDDGDEEKLMLKIRTEIISLQTQVSDLLANLKNLVPFALKVPAVKLAEEKEDKITLQVDESFIDFFGSLGELAEISEKDTRKHDYGYASDDSAIADCYQQRSSIHRESQLDVEAVFDEYRARQTSIDELIARSREAEDRLFEMSFDSKIQFKKK